MASRKRWDKTGREGGYNYLNQSPHLSRKKVKRELAKGNYEMLELKEGKSK